MSLTLSALIALPLLYQTLSMSIESAQSSWTNRQTDRGRDTDKESVLPRASILPIT
jgi:hypothetical protein